ncbi:MAG TPA: carboxylating nicotinate-nucleotide diphosphorylase [Planctomycetes bacterium]|nr:carboxylating nicotinate-nucleotide diphosphorylase [Planctomycetota bacterium]
MKIPQEIVQEAVRIALEEDLDQGKDLSTEAVVPAELEGSGRILAREEGILAGIDLLRATFRSLDPEVRFEDQIPEGARFEAGEILIRIHGKARALLTGERTALNFLQRLSAIATRTQAFVDAIRGTGAAILETRKTTPGLRYLEKYAVRVGGGENHRFGLFDRVLLKENHFALSGNGLDPEGIQKTVALALDRNMDSGPLTAEARSLSDALAILRGGADIILLDNFTIEELSAAVLELRKEARSLGRDVLMEASGGVQLDNVAQIAGTGVDRISVGALTHSVRALDLSLLVEGV